MAFLTSRLSHKVHDETSAPNRSTEIQWAEFGLLKQTIHWLLVLLTIKTIAVVALMVFGQFHLAILGLGLLIGGNLVCIGRLMNISFRSIFRID